jgi:hypothetical protein
MGSGCGCSAAIGQLKTPKEIQIYQSCIEVQLQIQFFFFFFKLMSRYAMMRGAINEKEGNRKEKAWNGA